VPGRQRSWRLLRQSFHLRGVIQNRPRDIQQLLGVLGQQLDQQGGSAPPCCNTPRLSSACSTIQRRRYCSSWAVTRPPDGSRRIGLTGLADWLRKRGCRNSAKAEKALIAANSQHNVLPTRTADSAAHHAWVWPQEQACLKNLLRPEARSVSGHENLPIGGHVIARWLEFQRTLQHLRKSGVAAPMESPSIVSSSLKQESRSAETSAPLTGAAGKRQQRSHSRAQREDLLSAMARLGSVADAAKGTRAEQEYVPEVGQHRHRVYLR